MQKMLSYVRRAVDHYHMIDEGDRIAVGVPAARTHSRCSWRSAS